MPARFPSHSRNRAPGHGSRHTADRLPARLPTRLPTRLPAGSATQPVLRLALLLVLLAAGLLSAGCYTASAPRTASAPPAYTRAAEHHRAFASADALAAYLRHGSPAGPLLSAHRGGPAPGYPENALATLERTLRLAPALLEVDVRSAGDGTLVLLHDETLDRTTTGRGRVDAYALEELRTLLLRDAAGVTTPFRIPTLAETLAWAEGRAVLTLDVKRGVAPEAVVEAVRAAGAEDRAVVIVYSLDDLLTYHRLAPDLVYSAAVGTPEEADALFATDVDPDRLIAFTGVGAVDPTVVEALHARGVRAMLGTFGLIDERAEQGGAEVYLPLLDAGIDVLATDEVALAARALAMRAPAD